MSFTSSLRMASNFFLADVATNLPMIAQAARTLEADHAHVDKYLKIRLVVCPSIVFEYSCNELLENCVPIVNVR